MAGIVMDVTKLSEVSKEEVIKEIEPVDEEKKKLIELAQKNVEAILSTDVNDAKESRSITSMIDTFGDTTVNKSAKKNQMVSVSLSQLGQRGGEGSEIATQLDNLNEQLKELDPSGIDFLKKGVFGKVAAPIKRYFKKYEKADDVVASIVSQLNEGKKTLMNDNVTLEIEQQDMRANTLELMKQIELGNQMDEFLTRAVEKAKADGEDEFKIQFVENHVLFPLRQKIIQLEQMLAVNQQGYFAVDITIKNNKELIQTVGRVTSVAVTALRTGVMIASALYNQKIVIEKVNSTNELVNSIIAGNSKMMKEQGTEIHRQAVESSLDVGVLKQAFTDCFDALDEIDNFKKDALPVLKDSIQQFVELTTDGEKRIRQIENGYTS